MTKFKLAIFLCLLLAACAQQPSSPGKVLADTEVALTTAVKTSDQILTAACTNAASDQCGSALKWHANFLKQAKPAQTAIVTARNQMATDPAAAQSALAQVNAVLQQLNALIQAGVH